MFIILVINNGKMQREKSYESQTFHGWKFQGLAKKKIWKKKQKQSIFLGKVIKSSSTAVPLEDFMVATSQKTLLCHY